MPDEDGNPLRVLSDGEVKDIKELMQDHSIEQFLGDWPEEKDPSYWKNGDALLLETRVVRVKPREIVQSWELETD